MLIKKTDHLNNVKTEYQGKLISRDAHCIVIETAWPPNSHVNTSYGLVINPGDALIERFYLDRWYNIFEIYGPRVNGVIDLTTLRGYYCNITRPTLLIGDEKPTPDEIIWQDLELDVWLDPNGVYRVLDEDEFEVVKPKLNALEIASATGAIQQVTDDCLTLWRAHMNDRLAENCARRKWNIATAESCTGGLIGDTLTNRAGSSAYFMGGVLSYDNRIKRDVLGVRKDTLQQHGAVSELCALEMARGTRRVMGVEVGVSATGIAGPGGGTDTKPVGLVYVGVSTPEREHVARFVWQHDRIGNKRATADAALRLLVELTQ